MNVEVDGADEIYTMAADLSRAADDIGPKAQLIVKKTTLDIERDAKIYAPVDTGFLMGSIGHTDLRTVGQGGVLETEVGPTAEYGEYVERGTSTAMPQPFMGPAFDRHAPLFVEAFRQISGDIL